MLKVNSLHSTAAHRISQGQELLSFTPLQLNLHWSMGLAWVGNVTMWSDRVIGCWSSVSLIELLLRHSVAAVAMHGLLSGINGMEWLDVQL
jgi:hypothetical protein